MKKLSQKNLLIISIIATAIVAGGVGYYSGSKGNQTAMNSNKSFGGAMGRNGNMPLRGNVGGGVVSGNVISFQNGMMTVGTRDGASKVVIVTDSTKVLKSVVGVKTDVVVGAPVTILGPQNGDGSVTAESVQIRPAMTVPSPVASVR